MKIITITLALLLCIPAVALAADLVCSAQEGVVAYNVEVDGVVASNVPAEPSGAIEYNLDHLAPGPHVFRLQAIGEGGWPSDWSLPLSVTKPSAPGGVGISS